MKLKSISIASLAAIYASGICATVVDNTTNALITNENKLKQVTEFNKVVTPERQSNKSYNLGMKNGNGANIALKPKKLEDKLKIEADLLGEQVYIVELYGETSIAQYAMQMTNLNSQTHGNSSVNGLKGSAIQTPAFASIENKLKQQQDVVISAASKSVGRPLTTQMRFSKSLNGFTVKMTQHEAQEVAKLGAVKQITRRKIYELNTDIGPSIIDAPTVWANADTTVSSYKGEGVIVGIIDTGINTDHESFSALGGDGYTVKNPLGTGNYLGDCSIAEFAERCNDKLIGVFSYESITEVYSAPEFQDPNHPFWLDPLEIRPKFGEDYNGHGSHTASTAAGNVVKNVPYVASSGVEGDGIPTGFEFSEVSGVAPHANVVAFQVCYPGAGGNDVFVGCTSDAMVAAIEDSIEAGVDVINFSIGSPAGSNPWSSPTQLAFLNAQAAGISIAASAGNTGTDGSRELYSYIDNTSPWVLTVAASSTGRTVDVEGKTLTGFTVTDGNSAPSDIIGSSISGSVTGYLVNAADFGDELCENEFTAGTFTDDQIVICKRGTNARLEKADNVLAGGAGGFILYNTSWSTSTPEGTTYNDMYSLPGIHIDAGGWYDLSRWLATGSDHMATITESSIVRNVDSNKQDQLADFSSRGPSLHNPEHLVPAVTAPGVNIYAANADDQPFSSFPQASDWAMMSGTSMAAPHTAGAMALVKSVHPDWTPQQINSALQMTAEQVVKYQKQSWSPTLYDAGMYRAGSGRINVNNAINTGLIMDESADNFRAANPAEAGVPTRLNLPELVNFNCKAPCSWVREVTATKDGTWTVETETTEYSVRLSAFPDVFSIKAGETKSLLITADIVDAQDVQSNAEVEVHGSVSLKPSMDMMDTPNIYWPVAFKYDSGRLPDLVKFEINRDKGRHHLGDIQLPETDDAQYNITQVVKGEQRTISLLQNQNSLGFGNTRQYNEADDYLYTVEVPHDSARFIVETIRRSNSTADVDIAPLWGGDADIYVGIDLNNDGMPNWDEEAICASFADRIMDFCNIDNPDAGTYWVLIDNYRGADWETTHTDEFIISTAVVPKALADNATLEGPANSDGLSPVSIDLNWDLTETENEDKYYASLLFGTDADNIRNIDSVAVNLSRGDDEFTVSSSQEKALAEQRISLNYHVKENLDGYDKDFELTVEIPEGVVVDESSLKLSQTAMGEVIFEDGMIKVTGVQPSTANKVADYLVTTNLENAQCKVPDVGQPDNGYINLFDYGFEPTMGGTFKDVFEFDIRGVLGPDAVVSMYNNAEYERTPIIRVNPMGYIQFDELPDFFGDDKTFPFDGFPHIMIAPLLRGAYRDESGISTARQYTPLNSSSFESLNTGITVAYTNDGQLIFEWDKARSTEITWDYAVNDLVYNDRDDSFDFEIIYDTNYRFGDNEFEIYMAYDNVEFGSENGHGSIGFQAFTGPRDPYGPVFGYKGVQYAYNDLKERISEGTVICYDYVGPESSQFDLSFDVLIKSTASGRDLNFVGLLNGTDSETNLLEHTISVASNIKLGQITDQEMMEEGTIEDIMVAYADSNIVPNTISVTGEGITAIINGHATGSTFDLIGDKDFAGETEVTVSVTDNNNSGDVATTTFTVMVTGTEDSPTIVMQDMVIPEGEVAVVDASASFDPDGDMITFEWSEGDYSLTTDESISSKVTLSDLQKGANELTLLVTDSNGNETEKTITIYVNSAPVLKGVTTSFEILVGDSVTLDASDATDEDGDDLDITWSSTSLSEEMKGETISLTNLDVGNHTVTATINDGLNIGTVVTYSVNVLESTSNETSDDSSGGSIPLGAITLMSLIVFFRRFK